MANDNNTVPAQVPSLAAGSAVEDVKTDGHTASQTAKLRNHNLKYRCKYLNSLRGRIQAEGDEWRRRKGYRGREGG